MVPPSILIDIGCIQKTNGVTNGAIRSGFPLNKDFAGIPLIADIYGDDSPEIICKTTNSILVISDSGDVIEQLPLYSANDYIILIPHGDDTYIINGNRSYRFDKNNPNAAFWLNPYSGVDNYPLSGVDVNQRFIDYGIWDETVQQNDYGLDISKAFNYPNPFEDETVFRFFVGSSNSIRIKVYNAAGFLIYELQDNNLQEYQYNEYTYDTSKLDPGVYFAEIRSDKKESKLIKLLKIK